MSVARMTRFLSLLVCAIVLLTCTSAGGRPQAVGCVPNLDKQNPVICIDDAALKVEPKTITVHNRKKWLPWIPVKIRWYTASGTGRLRIDIPSDCVKKTPDCTKEGECTALTMPGVVRDCNYDIWLDAGGGEKQVDPTIILTNCC